MYSKNMTNSSEIKYSEKNEINSLFVGRSIVSADKDTAILTLDNGVKVKIVPNEGGCCASGDYFLTNIEKFENVITSAKVKIVENSKTDKKTYKLSVYGVGVKNHQTVATITGDDGNGYYGTGFVLEVVNS